MSSEFNPREGQYRGVSTLCIPLGFHPEYGRRDVENFRVQLLLFHSKEAV